MRHASWFRRGVGISVVVLAGWAGTPAAAQDKSASAPVVAELVKMLDAAKATAIAAPYPGSPDQFVGALYFPGSQLLVVTAKYSAPQLMTTKLQQKSYQDIYIDLNSASMPNTKIFISDLGADGLKARRRDNEPFDTADIRGKAATFDGDWGKAKISEKDYMGNFTSAEDEYVKMLQALLSELKK
jgi:hypothetical protein